MRTQIENIGTINTSTQIQLPDETEKLIEHSLKEDIQSGDLTTNAIVPQSAKSSGRWIAKQQGIVAGLFIGEAVFEMLDENVSWNPQVQEGELVEPGDVLVNFTAESRALLTGERTALNFVQRMSGIATAAHQYIGTLNGYSTKILDTRKTVPGMRVLDKYAVRTGGAENHRAGLFDMVLIKENHIAIAGGIEEAVQRAKKHAPDTKIEVETTSLGDVEQALDAGVDMIMLDNMSTEEMKEAVRLIDNRACTEASGNITPERLNEIASTGVDYISAGALTHSVNAFDISQLIID
jgi:nicotinate-nucleotide pyrophosphorylase (carboxylating)